MKTDLTDKLRNLSDHGAGCDLGLLNGKPLRGV